MIDLLLEYQVSRNKAIAMLNNTNDENEIKIIKSMILELEYVIKWLKTGHNPNDYNAIDKRTVYLVDPQTIEAVIEDNHYIKLSTGEYIDYLNDEQHLIHKVLNKLSTRELEVFLMMACEGMSDGDVVKLLNIKRTSVNTFMERAKMKVKNSINELEAIKLIEETSFTFKKFQAMLYLITYNAKDNTLKHHLEGSNEGLILNYLLSKLSKRELKILMHYKFIEKDFVKLSEIFNTKPGTIQRNIINSTNKIRITLNEEPIKFTNRITKSEIEGSIELEDI